MSCEASAIVVCDVFGMYVYEQTRSTYKVSLSPYYISNPFTTLL
jgi:hypothetical protein